MRFSFLTMYFSCKSKKTKPVKNKYKKADYVDNQLLFQSIPSQTCPCLLDNTNSVGKDETQNFHLFRT